MNRSISEETKKTLKKRVTKLRNACPMLLFSSAEVSVPIAILQWVFIKDERFGPTENNSQLILLVQQVVKVNDKCEPVGDIFDICTGLIVRKFPSVEWKNFTNFLYPMCTLCGMIIEKIYVKCGCCEKVVYCSQQCCQDDWVENTHMETCGDDEAKQPIKKRYNTKTMHITQKSIYWNLSFRNAGVDCA